MVSKYCQNNHIGKEDSNCRINLRFCTMVMRYLYLIMPFNFLIDYTMHFYNGVLRGYEVTSRLALPIPVIFPFISLFSFLYQLPAPPTSLSTPTHSVCFFLAPPSYLLFLFFYFSLFYFILQLKSFPLPPPISYPQ